MSAVQEQLRASSGDHLPFGWVSLVLEKLIEMGCIIVAMRLGDMPTITIKPCDAAKKFDSRYRGYKFDGRQYFAIYSAQVDGVQVEWLKPRAQIKPWGEL